MDLYNCTTLKTLLDTLMEKCQKLMNWQSILRFSGLPNVMTRSVLTQNASSYSKFGNWNPSSNHWKSVKTWSNLMKWKENLTFFNALDSTMRSIKSQLTPKNISHQYRSLRSWKKSIALKLWYHVGVYGELLNTPRSLTKQQ